MYTITRKLAVVCLAVVFSVLMYGCGGGGSEQASTDTPPTDTPPTDMVMTVDMDMVTVGLIVPSGTFTILPGESRDQYDATFTCPEEGLSCEVTVADDRTATSVGGLATAMNSVPGNDKLAVSNDVDTGDVTVGLEITAVTYTIQPGGSMDFGEARITCDTGGVPCVVTVDANGDATSVGGMATAMNSDAGNDRLAVSNDVGTGDVTDGLIIRTGTYTIQPGEYEDLYDARITCALGGVPCVVTVELDADGTPIVRSAGGMATAMNSPTGNNKLAKSNPADRSLVTAGLIIKPGTYIIQPGKNTDDYPEYDTGEVTFSCPAGGVRCIVTVTEDEDADGEKTGTTTVTSVGGTARAVDSSAGKVRLAKTYDAVDISGLAVGFMTLKPGTYIIQPGENTEDYPEYDTGDATFVCPEGGVPCVVTVEVNLDPTDGDDPTTDAVTTVETVGGEAYARSSTVAMMTKTAIDLSVADGGLSASVAIPGEGAISVKRSPDGVTTVTLTTTELPNIPFTREAVDDDHGINGWIGQTLKRGGSGVVGLLTPQEATVYTNIDPSTSRKLKYGGDDSTGGAVPDPTAAGTVTFVLDAGQGDANVLNEIGVHRQFTGAYGGISGTFTCAAGTTCTVVETDDELPAHVGQRVLTNHLALGWKFESVGNVDAVAKPDEDYMFFGYWLQKPAMPNELMADYDFNAFFGSAADDSNNFAVPGVLTDASHAMTATYKGEAAGRYATRNLRFTNDDVDANSPGSHGSFTAKAELKANFGAHDDLITTVDGVQINNQNRIGGTITDFMDGDTRLGFTVNLVGANGNIVSGSNAITGASVTAEFDETPTSSPAADLGGDGSWNAAFFGPNADTDDPAAMNSTLPSGVAGRFNVRSNSGYTNVAGAFAATNNN